VLFVAYQFPPVGGAGVQRPVKFVKYLPEHGWDASVLTVANPSVPVQDGSLLADLPQGTLVRRARTWEPGYAVKAAVAGGQGKTARGAGRCRRLARDLVRHVSNLMLQPDPQILWLPAAVREGLRLVREVPHDAIVATAPPFSGFLVGAALSKRTGLPLVLDYRDEWDISSTYWENKRLGLFARYVQRRMQRRVVRAARALVATTRASARALADIRAAARAEARVECIYNGFDPDDFPAAPAVPSGPHRPYRLTYAGTLWELTSVAPLVEAVRRLATQDPSLAAGLELVFAGRRTGAQDELLGRLKGLPCRLVTHSYLDHAQATNLVRSSDGLCAILSDLPGVGRVVPAKVFEYMAARRPILAIAPRGELWDLLQDHPRAFCHTPGDPGGIAGRLAQEVRRHREGAAALPCSWDPSRYDRRRQAGQLAALLDSLGA
jgi:glycosyltransferase involved in cell wall biosynthesis